ncbi:MAG: signal peptidase II [Solobacterium sp.]|jgi:signal peptidase II|nr:signal peptidase II [Solobacterium sp.]MCH4205079.1 signal peptidase II [Solobacterium sp.]MCH4226588.1 signal peptidase II [Solobacterium sp.]MCH4281872.1 signal peptidase II [Solobacterium sp.]
MIILLIIVCIAADQISKIWIASNTALHSVMIIRNFFYITYAENTGMAWSMLSGHQAFFCLAATVAIGVMLWYMIYKNPNRLTKISLALMIAGAAGNLADRLLLGYVRDFLHFFIFGYDFPIFNIADSCLTVGVILLILASFLEEKKHEQTRVEN